MWAYTIPEDKNIFEYKINKNKVLTTPKQNHKKIETDLNY